MAVNNEPQKWLAVSSLVGALAASSCCIAPLALFGLGVSGAWIGALTRLAPYQPCFLSATLLCLGAGYALVYRASNRECAKGEACASPLPNRWVRVSLVVATILALAALGFDFLGPLLLNS
jgi:mercuric ion transport protein